MTLKEMREAVKMSQNDASRALDITKDYVSMIETNRRTPSSRLIEKMAIVYKRPPEEIFLAARRTYCTL
jgi:transcriptional regulator with XRE-family HTH domain